MGNKDKDKEKGTASTTIGIKKANKIALNKVPKEMVNKQSSLKALKSLKKKPIPKSKPSKEIERTPKFQKSTN